MRVEVQDEDDVTLKEVLSGLKCRSEYTGENNDMGEHEVNEWQQRADRK